MPLLLCCLVSVALLLVSSAARAEGHIRIVEPRSLARLDRLGAPVEKRPPDRKPEGISHHDCMDDQRVRFSIELADLGAGSALGVWAGPARVDCAASEARSGEEPTCTRLVAPIPAQPNLVLDVPVRALVSVAASRPPTADRDVCDGVDFTTVAVHFLAADESAGDAAGVAHARAAIEIDTVGPRPPRGLRTRPANERIELGWEGVDDPGGLSAVRAYCDVAVQLPAWRQPPDGGTTRVCRSDGGAVDGGADDGGADRPEDLCADVPNDPGAEIPAVECASTALESVGGGEILPSADLDARFACGETVSDFEAGMRLETLGGAPLDNGRAYAAAVAATDRFGNVGPLSAVACEVPEPTNEFWEGYQDAGGGGGGGYCSTSAPGLWRHASLSSLLVIGLGLLVRRRWSAR